MDAGLWSWIVPPQVLTGPWTYAGVVALTGFLVGVSKAGFGGGVGALATPLVLLVLPGPTALSLTLPILLACDVMTMRHFTKAWDRAAARVLAPGMAVGLLVGLGLLVWLAKRGGSGDLWIRFVAGTVVVALAAIGALFGRRRAAHRPHAGVGALTGLVCGTTTMVAHAAGVLLNLYLLARRPTPQSFVGTSTRLYLVFNLAKLPLFALATPLAGREFLTWSILGYSLWAVPFGFMGVSLGANLNRTIPQARYLRIVHALLLVTGTALAIDAGRALLR